MAGYIGPAPVPQATQNREAFTATSNQTSFATAGYTPQFIDVYLNGVKLAAADYTATNGSDVVLASGATVGDILEVVAFSAFTVADQAFTGTTTVDNLTVAGNATFGDDDKAIFGDESDLQIYANGGYSYIDETGAQNLNIRTNGANIGIYDTANNGYMGKFTTGGAAELYHNGSSKLATTSTGVDITGTLTSDVIQSSSTGSASAPAYSFDGHTTAGFYRPSGLGSSIGVATSGAQRALFSNNGDISFYEDTGTTPKFFWDASAESLGIGDSTPSDKLSLEVGSANEGLSVYYNGTEVGSFRNDAANLTINANNANLKLATGGSEAMRINSSGDLLVGLTSTTDNTGVGHRIREDGLLTASRDGTAAQATAGFNKVSNDGDIVHFNKSGAKVGSIGTDNGGDLFIGNDDTGFLFAGGSDAILPWNPSGPASRDNAIDLGNASHRFDDIYATNSTIQTSDRNEKQDIAELSDAEQRVAVAAKGLLRKFRWKDAVAEKGDEARIHFGIIAQDLQAAFAAEGLNASDYAMFISSTWTDEDTGEERTRMGVRYSELLAFIIAAI